MTFWFKCFIFVSKMRGWCWMTQHFLSSMMAPFYAILQKYTSEYTGGHLAWSCSFVCAVNNPLILLFLCRLFIAKFIMLFIIFICIKCSNLTVWLWLLADDAGWPNDFFLVGAPFMPSFIVTKSTSAYAGGHLTLSREFVCAVNNPFFLIFTFYFAIHSWSKLTYLSIVYLYVCTVYLKLSCFPFCIVVTSFIVVLTK